MVMVRIESDVKHVYQGECLYTPDKGWSCRIVDRQGREVDVVSYYPTKDRCRAATLKRVIEIVKAQEGSD